ncbi:MAG: hypothetical protein HY303_18405 [Candidatus Wallbacteria bacterium]|nr:hypothetical protein [Candidatus Wallbacteria bacterium]
MLDRRIAGSFAIEVLVAALVAAAVAVPLLTLLFQERDSEQRSRFEYLAILAARDEMYESRMAVACGAPPDKVAHPWRPLKGNVMERLKDAAPDLALDVSYHPDQARVATQAVMDAAGANPRLRSVTLDARWIDPTTGPPSPDKRERPSSLQLIFGVLVPPWVPSK